MYSGTAPFERNLPVLMGLLSIWYRILFGTHTVAVLSYEQYLKRFPAYLPAVDHGEQRQTCNAGRAGLAYYDTSPIYWANPAPTGSIPFQLN